MELIEKVWTFFRVPDINEINHLKLTISFLTIHIFKKYIIWKFFCWWTKRNSKFWTLWIYWMNCCLYCDRSFINKYCDKSFKNKPAFLNFVPQVIRKIYCMGTTWFYRFACAIVAQAHIFLMTRLINKQNNNEIKIMFCLLKKVNTPTSFLAMLENTVDKTPENSYSFLNNSGNKVY